MTSTHGFEDFVRSYQNMVYSTAVRILGNETDAQDIAQEVFLRGESLRAAGVSHFPGVQAWVPVVD